MKKKLTIWVLPLLAALVVACGVAKSKGDELYLCKQEYALCTSARCIPDPLNPKVAICFCDVEEGYSMASVPCEKTAPANENGIKTVTSAFSLEQLKSGKQVMTCPAGTPWTWCLDKKCTVDPTDPKKAICICDVVRQDEWITFGGDCDTSTCETGYWSAARIPDFKQGIDFLKKSRPDDVPPIKWCQSER
jgi:hypothetical protein